MADTWTNRDLPVLKAIVEIFEEEGDASIDAGSIRARSGFDEDTVQRALRALYTEPYLREDGKMAIAQGDIWYVGAPTGEALRVVGQWPTPETMLDRLVAALESAGEDETRPEDERGKLKQAAAWLGSFASQVAIGALGGAGGNMLS